MNPVELIIKKRNGESLSSEEMRFFISSYLEKKIPEYQMSSMLMAIYFRGMSNEEIIALTDVYINSGERILFAENLETVDKHSTGGVGDKITLMLAPIVSALGCYDPMISGRGLGHTGGTLDKLEAIPGFTTGFSGAEFKKMVEKNKLAIIQQSHELVPADKNIYALRDVTGTVESLPLITASIMSKKIAEGAQNLAIDLKVGSGAFMKNIEQATELAKLLKMTGEAFNQKVKITFTNMNSPLGFCVGNALEIRETIEYLKGKRIPDIDIITKKLAKDMLLMSGRAATALEAEAMVIDVIESGKALQEFTKFIENQGGNPAIISDYTLLPHTKKVTPIVSKQTGYVKEIDSKGIGYSLIGIGAGRKQLEDELNYASGAELFKKVGDYVSQGDVIGYLHCDDIAMTELTCSRLVDCYKIVPEKVCYEDIILGELS